MLCAIWPTPTQIRKLQSQPVRGSWFPKRGNRRTPANREPQRALVQILYDTWEESASAAAATFLLEPNNGVSKVPVRCISPASNALRLPTGLP